MKLKPGDSAIIEMSLNRLYKTHRWIFVTDKKDGRGNWLVVGKQFDEYYKSGIIRKKDLALYVVIPESETYKESSYKLKKEDYQIIINEIFQSEEIKNSL